MKTKFSLVVRVDRLTPMHVYCSIFCANIPKEQEHPQATRALTGTLVLRIDEFEDFLERVRPDLILGV